MELTSLELPQEEHIRLIRPIVDEVWASNPRIVLHHKAPSAEGFGAQCPLVVLLLALFQLALEGQFQG